MKRASLKRTMLGATAALALFAGVNAPSAASAQGAPFEGTFFGANLGYGGGDFKGMWHHEIFFKDFDLHGIAGGAQAGHNGLIKDFFGPGQHLLLGSEIDGMFTDFPDACAEYLKD